MWFVHLCSFPFLDVKFLAVFLLLGYLVRFFLQVLAFSIAVILSSRRWSGQCLLEFESTLKTIFFSTMCSLFYSAGLQQKHHRPCAPFFPMWVFSGNTIAL